MTVLAMNAAQGPTDSATPNSTENAGLRELTEGVKRYALSLGFDLCRVTSGQPPASGERFSAWLAAGRQGTMEYLSHNAAKRLDPQRVLPGVRAVLCLAASYHLEGSESLGTPKGATGIVARYARFEDYHDVLGAKLRAVAAVLNERGGAGSRSLWYVDTGPLLERDLAERAGLGFIGKHTNLINRRLGNWFFLAEILTTVGLEPDPPERNRCGTCTRCLDACPTGALPAPFVLDARRCISYLTIELKGPIPEEWRSAIGTRIFGCDDCLEACPWNRFAQGARLMRPHTRPDLHAPDLIEWLRLDESGFRARFRGTPIARARRRGLLRNVCVALGNLRDPAALPALERAASDSEPLVAEHARWAIKRIEAVSGGALTPNGSAR